IAGVHDRRPLGNVVDDARAEFVGGRGPRIVAERAQTLHHRRLLENGDDLRVQAIDDRRGKTRGREQTLPTRHHVAGNTGLGDGRDVGKREKALPAGDRERAPNTVYPSGAARATSAAAAGPDAPGLLSITIRWPSRRVRPSATMRATRSVGPPGGKPCIIVIGRSGQSGLARAGAAASIAKGPAIAMRRVTSVMRVILRWLGVEQCRTLGVLREQTEFAAHTEFYSSERTQEGYILPWPRPTPPRVWGLTTRSETWGT